MQTLHACLRFGALLPQRALTTLVRGYRLLLRPWIGNACRFEPSCSAYALQALERHGAVVGTALTTTRLLRCAPWCQGGCDEVPQQVPRLFSQLGLGHRAPSSSNQSPP